MRRLLDERQDPFTLRNTAARRGASAGLDADKACGGCRCSEADAQRAAAIMMSIPVIIVFIVLQKYLLRGSLFGAVEE